MKNLDKKKKYIKFIVLELEELKEEYSSYAEEYYEDGCTGTSFPIECLKEEFWSRCGQVLEKAEDRGIEESILQKLDDFCRTWH